MQTEIRKFGIERCARLLELMGNPDKKLKIVHIAGTNGKGSTSAYISHILRGVGKKTGTFTSPQVYCFEEQFCIDCQPIDTQKLNAYFDKVKEVAATMDDASSPFEVQTATALFAFYEEGCEYAVIECGLGGKDDATNAVAQKCVAVITSISLEHTQELGDTIEKICLAKSGIIKNCPVVVSALQSSEGLNFFSKFRPIFAGVGLQRESHFPYGESFIYNGEEYEIALNGSAQCYNAACAIEACNLLGIDKKFIKEGLKNTTLPGRVQSVRKGDRLYILDGSHNPSAFAPLIDGVKGLPQKPDLVFGCLSDKDVESIAEQLAPHFKRALIFPPNSPRAMDADKIFSAFKGKIQNINKYNSVEQALEEADSQIIVVCGSFTIIREAWQWIEKR